MLRNSKLSNYQGKNLLIPHSYLTSILERYRQKRRSLMEKEKNSTEWLDDVINELEEDKEEEETKIEPPYPLCPPRQFIPGYDD
jgi:hypothetical protein